MDMSGIHQSCITSHFYCVLFQNVLLTKSICKATTRLTLTRCGVFNMATFLSFFRKIILKNKTALKKKKHMTTQPLLYMVLYIYNHMWKKKQLSHEHNK